MAGKSIRQRWKEEGFKIKLTHKYDSEYGYDVVYKGKKYIIDIHKFRGFWITMVLGPDGKAILPKQRINQKGLAFLASMQAIKKHLGLTT